MTKRPRRLISQSPNHPITQSLRRVTIGFIGAGTMGQALMKGLLAQGCSPRHLCAIEPNPAIRRAIRRRLHVASTTDYRAIVRRSDIVVLAVKPQQLPEVLNGLSPHVARKQLVISIAAGITLRWLQSRLPGQPIIRVMPNLPATVQCGFSAMTMGRWVTKRHRAMAQTLFGAVGEVCELPERYFDAITAVSGSGPAYVFFLVHAWNTAARTLGLPAGVAEQAIRQTLVGSVRLLQTAREPAVVLMQNVASKRGTTEAALKVLARRRVAAHVVEAVRAAAKRSRALSA